MKNECDPNISIIRTNFYFIIIVLYILKIITIIFFIHKYRYKCYKIIIKLYTSIKLIL